MNRPQTIILVFRLGVVALAGLLLVIGARLAATPRNRAITPDSLFSGRSVPLIEIELSPENAEALERNPRTYTRAHMEAGGESFPDVGVHLKGSGTFQTLAGKPSFTLDFQKFHGERRFGGVTKIHLNNSLEDSTYVQEKLGSELFRSAGIPAPRVGHARVKLNGRDLGLYVLKEGFTREFLVRSFGRAESELYEATVPEPLAAAALDSNLASRWQKLNAVLDMDRFLTFMAMEVLICHWDGYSLAQNNFRACRDPGTGKYVFLPTGMDQLFGNPAFPSNPDMTGLVARSLMELPEARERYEEKLHSLLRANFHSAHLTKEVELTVASLRAYVSRSAFKQMREDADELSNRIVERHNRLDQQFDGKPFARHEERNSLASRN